MRPPDAPGGRVPSALVARRRCKQHGDRQSEVHCRPCSDLHTRGDPDLHGPPPVRQPGYLREARGFASPPRDGFAIVGRSAPGRALTDSNRVGRCHSAAPEANSGHPTDRTVRTGRSGEDRTPAGRPARRLPSVPTRPAVARPEVHHVRLPTNGSQVDAGSGV